jgi:hypothetical protein
MAWVTPSPSLGSGHLRPHDGPEAAPIVETLRRHRPRCSSRFPRSTAPCARRLGRRRVCLGPPLRLAAERFRPDVRRLQRRFGLTSSTASVRRMRASSAQPPGEIMRGTTGAAVPATSSHRRRGRPRPRGPAVGVSRYRGLLRGLLASARKTKRCMQGDWFATGDRSSGATTGLCTSAAWTTCSRSAACGSRRSRLEPC